MVQWQYVKIAEKVGKFKMKKWYKCPNCVKKIIKYNEDAYSKGIFFLCKNKTLYVNIEFFILL